MQFPAMIVSVPCMTDKVKLKSDKKIINFMRNKTACKMHDLSSVLYCPKVHWSLLSERLTSQILPERNMLGNVYMQI